MSAFVTPATRVWHRVPPVWRRALLGTAALWLVSTVVVVVAAGTLPLRETVDVQPAPGFGGWTAPPADAAGAELLGTGLVRFDALWYLAIAADGYPTSAAVPQAAAFFPGYPALVAGLGAALGGRLVLAAHLVSLVACVVALAGLQRLAALVGGAGPGGASGRAGSARDPSDEDELARRVVLVTVAFPTAFFLVAPYAEALFLACAVWALVHAARGRPWLAALLTAAATLTRPVGVLLVVPLLLGVVPGGPRGPGGPPRTTEGSRHPTAVRWRTVRGMAGRVLPAAGSGVALGAVALAGWAWWDDPLAVMHAQSGWQRALAAPWDSLVSSVLFAVRDLGGGFTGYHLLDLVVVGAATGAVVVLGRRRQWPLVAHAGANLLLWLAQPYPARPLLSAPRFALVVPGVLLGLALGTASRTAERVWLPLTALLFGLHLALFSRWWFVF